MTDREAIARFEPYIGNECYRKEFQEACAHAISAIKEREERSKGCEFCGAKLYFKTTQLRSTYGVETEPEIITNADRIREMDDNELSEFFDGMQSG